MRFFLRSAWFAVVALLAGLYAIAQPSITSFSPLSGPVGTTVTITGANFDPVAANNIVRFGGALATVSAASATSLTVTVPAGANYQPVTVTTANKTAYSLQAFVVTFAGGGAISASTFAARADFSTGASTTPEGVAVGDLDGDGKLDVVAANSNTSSNTMAVFLNTSTAGTVSFAPVATFPTVLNGPNGVALGDIDGDGKLDVVVTDKGTQAVSAFRNISTPGSISFEAKVNFNVAASSNPRGIAIYDVDKDGKPDVVVVNTGANSISVLRNQTAGTGTFINSGPVASQTFAAPVNIATGSVPEGIAIGDIDNDSKADVIVSNSGGTGSISAFRNISTPGTISLVAKVDFTVGGSARGLAIGDLDGDGKPDVAVANSASNAVSLLRNTAVSGNFTSGTFATSVNVATGNQCRYVYITDLDGDGKPDLAASNTGANTISVLRNAIPAPGNLSASDFTGVNYATGTTSGPAGICAGDLDGDGKPELITAESTTNVLSVFRSEIGNPVITSFAPSQARAGETVTITGTNFTGVTAVSFGGTPAAVITPVDATTIIAEVAEGTSGSIRVTTPQGVSTPFAGFTFLPGPIINSVFPVTGPVGQSVSISGRGFSVIPANNTVYFGAVKATVNTATSKQLQVTVPAGLSPHYITVTKNNLTAYAGTPFTTTFVGNNVLPAGFTRTTTFIAASATPYSTVSGDFDGDGYPDVATSNNGTATISVFRNNNSGSSIVFDPTIVTLATLNQPRQMALADMDGDGKLDIVVANYGITTGGISVFRNTSTAPGSISFATKVDNVYYSGNSKPTFLVVTDLDNDGKPDVIVANEATGDISVLKNTSSGVGAISFAANINFAAGSTATGIAVGDLDGDRLPDIAIACSGKYIRVFKNTNTVIGTISLTQVTPDISTSLSFTPYAVAMHDIDADGKPDVVEMGSNHFSAFRNISTVGTIALDTRVDYALTGDHRSIVIGDLNGDAKPDLVTGDFATGNVFLVQNRSTVNSAFSAATFGTPVSLSTATPTSIFDIALSDLNRNGKQDIITANNSINSFSVFQNTTDNNTLPVTLISFTAKQVADAVKLDWATASEQNSDHFEIERSTNRLSFQKIGEVRSAGDSYDRKDYAFTDQFPQTGINYYRLKQVDKDGRFNYSDIRTVNIAAGTTGAKLVIYPNPVKSSTVLLKTSLADGTYEAVLLSSKGDMVQRQQVQVQGNQAKLVLTQQPARGAYWLQLNAPGNKLSEKLIVE